MSLHPMKYLREEFFEPMGVTQEELAERLSLGTKTMSELYQCKRSMTVPVAKKFSKLTGTPADKLLGMQALYSLENDKSFYAVKPLNVPQNTKSVLNLVNDKNNTYTIKDLRNMFKEDGYNKNDKLCVTLFKNIPLNKLVKYLRDTKVGLSHLKELYSYYLRHHNGKHSVAFESLLSDDDRTAVMKMCDNEKYFDSAREYEKYMFYRLSLLHKKKPLKDLAKNRKLPHEVRQRAAYLYNLSTGDEVDLGFRVTTPVRLYAKTKRVRTEDVNSYRVVAGVDRNRYDQFLETGSF